MGERIFEQFLCEILSKLCFIMFWLTRTEPNLLMVLHWSFDLDELQAHKRLQPNPDSILLLLIVKPDRAIETFRTLSHLLVWLMVMCITPTVLLNTWERKFAEESYSEILSNMLNLQHITFRMLSAVSMAKRDSHSKWRVFSLSLVNQLSSSTVSPLQRLINRSILAIHATYAKLIKR